MKEEPQAPKISKIKIIAKATVIALCIVFVVASVAFEIVRLLSF